MRWAFLSIWATGWSQSSETCEETGLLQMTKRGVLELSTDLNAILTPAEVEKLEPPERWHGANYGNRFLPEDWIKSPYDFFEGITDWGGPRVAMWDLPPGQASKDRMLKWLEKSIQEDDFKRMQAMGVRLLRLPVGYWNFVDYKGDEGPEVPEPFKERVKNLHRIASPAEYKPHLDKVFDYARQYGVKVLLDLHGLPGSQNGEIHSGACMREKEKIVSHFQNQKNFEKALETVREMARYGKEKEALWGIQVINEPHMFTQDEHWFLKKYYEDSCKIIREEGISMDKPCVVFTWTYDMKKWMDWQKPVIFPPETYGRVIFDTHIYHFESGEPWSVSEAQDAYQHDLAEMRSFALDFKQELIVGEWTLAGVSFRGEDLKSFARWLTDQFEFTSVGSLYWTLDRESMGGHDGWSFVDMNQMVHFKDIWQQNLHGCIPHKAITLKSSEGFLSGGAKTQREHSYEDLWQSCYVAKAKDAERVTVAFRNLKSARWLSGTPEGEVTESDIRQGWEEFTVWRSVSGYEVRSSHGTYLSGSGRRLKASPSYWDAQLH